MTTTISRRDFLKGSVAGAAAIALTGVTGGVFGLKADASESNGKILFLANTSSGPIYDFNIAYMDAWMSELGYTWEMVYGDSSNDPAGNLSAVKNAMTSDVVGIILCQDGGVANIMEEYPDLYVVGAATDMASVYDEDGASAACVDNDHFLGTYASGYASGVDTGKMYAEEIIEKGYKKVAICMFPSFAYPQYAIADETLRSEIASYNETVSEEEQIEITEETTVLMFTNLDDNFFNEPENQDLDAIIGLCGGQAFLYAPMLTAIANGTANPNMKLLTSGFENDADMMADVCSEDGIVQGLYVPNFECLFSSIVMLDNALQGTPFADYEQSEVLDGTLIKITDREIMENIINESPIASADITKLALSVEDGKQYFVRYNEDATYSALKELMASDTFTEKGYN
ncbi:MAG: twin-arginine translocation signal domain-containing protein [Clostridiales bacterium]|nr:twin-arginine translocation signal domain-containing protein [Clostridiales bacterium]